MGRQPEQHQLIKPGLLADISAIMLLMQLFHTSDTKRFSAAAAAAAAARWNSFDDRRQSSPHAGGGNEFLPLVRHISVVTNTFSWRKDRELLTGGEGISERLRLALVIQSEDGHWVLHQRGQVAEVIGGHTVHLHLQNMHKQTHTTQGVCHLTDSISVSHPFLSSFLSLDSPDTQSLS